MVLADCDEELVGHQAVRRPRIRPGPDIGDYHCPGCRPSELGIGVDHRFARLSLVRHHAGSPLAHSNDEHRVVVRVVPYRVLRASATRLSLVIVAALRQVIDRNQLTQSNAATVSRFVEEVKSRKADNSV
jgi:hypothetical protein